MLSRRDFCTHALALPMLGCGRPATIAIPPGELLGSNMALGHRLREQNPVAGTPSETRDVPILIIGGGVAGLSCGWWLRRHGVDDFLLLELENQAGGNARGGATATGQRFPWGAHYLPLPGEDARYVRLLLSDLGVLKGDPQAAKPEYDPRHLCHAPQERLFINGRWQEGLVPTFGIDADGLVQQQRFEELMRQFKALRGADGRWAFTIPAALSSRDPDILALDTLSMYDWLVLNRLTSPALHWFVNYGCRDDYGTDYRNVSAWAGIHYHAGRRGQASNALDDIDLTWPEGNQWLTDRMVATLGDRVSTGQVVYRVTEVGRHVQVDAWQPERGRAIRYRAERLVWAAPVRFLPYVWFELPPAWRAAAERFEYAPWITASLTLAAPLPQTGGMPLCWDNVLYDSLGLGYVDATHQYIGYDAAQGTVLTYYRALHELSPAAGRKRLLETPREDWATSILADLAQAHPDIARQCQRLDVWRWGHAMAQPRPRWLHTGVRESLQQPQGRIAIAHADLSGFSLFEEANYWGVEAASWLMGNHPAQPEAKR